jgi:CHAT domain-containing protein
LAFEALFFDHKNVEQQTDWREFPYLIKKYALVYGYSASLLLEQNAPTNTRSPRKFAGFAPKYDLKMLRSDDTLTTRALANIVRGGDYELQGAQHEVSEISKLVGGQFFQNESASEDNFRRHAGDFQIIHLAMHAIAEDQNPMLSRLLFTKNPTDSVFDNQLTCAEIYGLSLPSDLAVLTACNSGFGQLRRGEGSISLARAFTFAGVRSTVMSLWQSPDAQTERLMILFYENLKSGMSKDEALRDAKIRLFSSASNPEIGHPFFWAGCVLNGNAQPLDLPDPIFQKWFLFGLLLLILLLFTGIFRAKERA